MNLEFLKQKRHFLVPFLLFVAILGTIQIMYGRDDIHLYINQFHNPFLDFFFKNLTYLGGGIGFALALIYLLSKHRKKALFYAGGYLISVIIVQLLKKLLFSDITRPSGYFRWKNIDIYRVPGIEDKTQYSFPSGHTADIFFVTCCFILLNNVNDGMQRVLFYIALLVGFSRVYLSHHFLIDIYTGAIIGVGFSFFTYWIAQKNIRDL